MLIETLFPLDSAESHYNQSEYKNLTNIDDTRISFLHKLCLIRHLLMEVSEESVNQIGDVVLKVLRISHHVDALIAQLRKNQKLV